MYPLSFTEYVRDENENPQQMIIPLSNALSEEMAKYPLRFCKPVYFGVPPSREHPITINNGTVSLLKRGEEFLAVTCAHVIAGYRRRLAEDDRCLFAVSNCYLDPFSQLIAEDTAVDAAVIRLTAEQADAIIHDSNGIGEAFYEIGTQSPGPVRVDEFITYGGFPGDLREIRAFNELNFGTYSSGSCRIADIHTDYIACNFEREYWIEHFGEPEPERLDGLSGGPAFLVQHGTANVISYKYIGMIYLIHPQSETLYIRHAAAIPLGWE